MGKYNFGRIRVLNDKERKFIQNDHIEIIDQKLVLLNHISSKLNGLDLEKKKISQYIHQLKKELRGEENKYTGLLRKGRNTIKLDLEVGDVITLNNIDGNEDFFTGDVLGFVVGDIKIIKLSECMITLQYINGITSPTEKEEIVVKTLHIDNFKQFYLDLFDNDQINSLIRNQTLNEILN